MSVRTMSAGIAGVLAGAVVAGGVAYAAPATHEVPRWMTRECVQEDDVNCYRDGGTVKPHQGEMYVRQIPGREHMVCVFFVNRPGRDYCA